MSGKYLLLASCLIGLTMAAANLVIERDQNVLDKKVFTIDWDKDTFLKDGKPFRFIAGSLHYFRAHPDSWQRKLRTLRASGLNAVTTYVEWSLHNPKEGVYNWDGMADLDRFIKLAEAEDLLVILRPGPYICAERDFGGFPYWLLRKYPDMQLRTADTKYLSEVRKWYSELMTRMKPYLYGNGGPIILVQVENEYGSFRACDKKYREWLRDETQLYVEDKAVLFTNDGPDLLNCGKIDGVLAGMDFGAGSDLKETWAKLRKFEPKGPLINAEYYPGWLTHWGEDMAHVATEHITETFTGMLNDGANVNFYMFFGGSNFGFTAGANSDGDGNNYVVDITSYDYDAPMDEAGDPTEKYFKLREIIGQYLPLPNITVPEPVPKKSYGSVELKPAFTLLSKKGRSLAEGTVFSEKPMSFEQLDQYSGFVLYETRLPKTKADPAVLKVDTLRDRGYVFVDNLFVGVLSRSKNVKELPIIGNCGRKLQILVENQGRINYNYPNDFKGILSDVLYDDVVLQNWTISKFPLDDDQQIQSMIREQIENEKYAPQLKEKILRKGPVILYGQLTIGKDDVGDTYLDTTGWGKGLVYINNFNLGRYWPGVGPQVTLFVPNEILREGVNNITVIEYQSAWAQKMTFTNVPNFDGI